MYYNTPRRTRRAAFARAGNVTVIKADGSRSEQPSYTDEDLARIDRKARRQPRTWDEINSSKGGGVDGAFVT